MLKIQLEGQRFGTNEELDYSVLPNNEELFLSYVSFIKEQKKWSSYLLKVWKPIYLIPESIFQEKDISIPNILSAAANRASEVMRCHKDFIAYLKQAVSNVFPVYCVTYCHPLVAKILKKHLHASFNYVITNSQ